MTSDQIRVGVLGAGRWGRNLVRTLDQLGALAVVHDPDPHVRAEMSATYPGITVTADLDEALAAPVQAFAIATPAATHAEITVAVLRSGKDVFVEKPFAMNVADAERMVKEAEAADRILMVGHLLMYQPAIRYLKDLLTSGRLGWVATLYQDRLNLGTVRTVENALWSLGVHDVAVLLHLAGGEPVRVDAWGQRILQPAIEDDMHLHLLFADGAEGHVHNSWLWPEQRRRLTIVGTEAMVVYDEATQEVTFHRRRVLDDLSALDEGSEVIFTGDPRPLKHEMEHFLECVGTRKVPLTSGPSAIPVVRVLEQADAQLRALGSGND